MRDYAAACRNLADKGKEVPLRGKHLVAQEGCRTMRTTAQ